MYCKVLVFYSFRALFFALHSYVFFEKKMMSLEGIFHIKSRSSLRKHSSKEREDNLYRFVVITESAFTYFALCYYWHSFNICFLQKILILLCIIIFKSILHSVANFIQRTGFNLRYD